MTVLDESEKKVLRYTVPYGQHAILKVKRCDNSFLALARILDGKGVPASRPSDTATGGWNDDPDLHDMPFPLTRVALGRSHLIELHCFNWNSNRGGPTQYHFEMAWEVAGTIVQRINVKHDSRAGEVYTGDPFIIEMETP